MTKYEIKKLIPKRHYPTPKRADRLTIRLYCVR